MRRSKRVAFLIFGSKNRRDPTLAGEESRDTSRETATLRVTAVPISSLLQAKRANEKD